jgi:hypothetical protein
MTTYREFYFLCIVYDFIEQGRAISLRGSFCSFFMKIYFLTCYMIFYETEKHKNATIYINVILLPHNKIIVFISLKKKTISINVILLPRNKIIVFISLEKTKENF